MVIKIFVSGISGNKEVKKRQQRVLLILDSKKLKYEVIDIAEPGAEEAKDFMQNNATANGATIGDQNPRHPLPPQIFNDESYCGDYNMFDLANEEDQMEQFLKLEPSESAHSTILATENNLKNGDSSNEEIKAEQLQETDTTENESKEKDISNDGESKADETSSNVINETEDIEVKKDEADIAASGDAAVENGKEEEEEAETTREPSPEKAEE